MFNNLISNAVKYTRDGQIRFLGLTAMIAGVLILTVLRQIS